MKRCDICGLGIDGKQYHSACLRKMFNKNKAPRINMKLQDVAIEAQKMAGKMSISGIQPKLSMIWKNGELIPVEMGGQYILKPQTTTFHNLPENENLCMNIAAQLGINVPPHGLFELADRKSVV